MSDNFTKELNSQDGLENIAGLQFSIFSHKMIDEGSVVDVLTADTYNGSIPVPKGLFDARMGSIDKYIMCQTDELDNKTSPGYFGRIVLPKPVFNFNFLPYVEKLLKCVCFRCGNVLFNKSDPNVIKRLEGKTGYTRFVAAVDLVSKIKMCINNNGCGVFQPKKYTRLTIDKIQEKDWIVKIIGEFNQNAFKDPNIPKDQNFTPEMCYKIFSKIKNSDVKLLGFSPKYSRPEWMIIKNLPVPPPSVRPSIRQDNNQRSEDDLTYSLSHITKQVKLFREKLESDSKKDISLYHGLLQYYVTTYMNNDIQHVNPINQRTSQRPLKALTQRLKDKDGRMRCNIQGKRVDYSGRTVISVDPNIKIDEWGVPMKIAMDLTYPEIVTKFNINKMYKLMKNGPNTYPGAKFITKMFRNELGEKNPSVFSLHKINLNVTLEYGDVVHRHLQDGDICLFNRQPSLHRMSMMAHKIKVMKYKTSRLNITICNPYNADFDGDEMNMHVPQSIECVEELKRIALVTTQLISPGSSSPCTPIVQDTIIGAYLLTKDENRLTKSDIDNLMMFNDNFSNELPEPAGKNEYGENYWDGKQLFSMILPKITIKTKTIEVKKGQITDGYLMKDSLESSTNGFIHQIYNAYGVKECSNFLNNTQDLITKFMTSQSFSIGYGDCIIPKEIIEENKIIIKEKIDAIDNVIRSAQEGVFKPELDKKYHREALEKEIMQNINEATNLIEKNLANKIDATNCFMKAVSSGSKGKTVNIRQILGAVGQQEVWDERPTNGFTDRVLPHFARMDISPSAKGFVQHSYAEGMLADEIYFHAMTGRTGVIDTAIKTADSGYISRKFIKATEDLVVNYDGTVRNTMDIILQFKYGDDGYDPTKLEKVPITLIRYSDDEMADLYAYDYEDADDKSYWLGFMTDEAAEKTIKEDDLHNKLEDELDRIFDGRDMIRNEYCKSCEFVRDANTYVPVNFYRLIAIIKEDFNIKSYSLTDMSPIYVINKVSELFDDITQFSLEKNHNLEMHKLVYLTYLTSKNILYHHRFNKVAFDYMIEKVKNKIFESFITPGETVGVIASQTCGEQSTQLTLNTFHLAGVGSGSKVITKGVPRLREIIHLSKEMKIVAMEIYLKEQYRTSPEQVDIIGSEMLYTKLSDVVLRTDIIYESDQTMSGNEVEEFIVVYNEFDELFDLKNDKCMSKWVLRIVFNKDSLMNNNISVSKIQELIYQKSGSNDIKCVFSDDNSSEVILRINVVNDGDTNNLDFIKDIEKNLMNMTITGIKGIEEIWKVDGNVIRYMDDGSYRHEKELLLTCNGTNLREILANDKVDITRTRSNNINEIYEIFGIEAARAHIIEELSNVFDNGLNPKHIDMIVDLMTYKGSLIQIARHGINRKEDTGPISKASFEEMMNIFVKAAVFAETDNMKGPSANMLAGQFCKSGTNSFDILMDTDKVINSQFEDTYNEYKNIDKDDIGTDDFDSFISNEFGKNKEVTDDDFNFGIDLPTTKLDNVELPNIEIEITKNNNVVKNITIENDNVNLGNIDINEEIDDITTEDEGEDEGDVFGNDEFEELESDQEDDEVGSDEVNDEPESDEPESDEEDLESDEEPEDIESDE